MEKEEIKKNLSYLNNFLGYGDSDKAKVFHIAIEEKLDPNCDQDEIIKNFIEQRDKGEIEILKKTPVHKGTEEIQSRLSYRLITEILGIEMEFSEEEYLKEDFEICRELEFCANVNPIACTGEKNWDNVNIVITGYDNKPEFLKDSWNGTGNFEGIKSREEVLTEFLKKIKHKMDNEKVFLFIEGEMPYKKLKSILENVFAIDTNPEKDKVNHLSHNGEPIFSFYGDLIWSIAHPSFKGRYFNNTDIDYIINYLNNK